MLTSSQPKRRPEAARTPSLLTRKQHLVRTAIWDAAIDLFAKNGFDKTTVEEIAQAAGVSRRSLFRYFSSKNDLMGEVMTLYAETLTEAIAAMPAAYSLLEVMHQTVLQIARRAAAAPRTRALMQIAASSPAAREAHLSKLSEVQDSVARAFARRSRKRSPDDSASRVLAGVTMSLLDVTFRAWFERDHQDIAVPVEQAFATLKNLFGDKARDVNRGNRPTAKRPRRPSPATDLRA